MWDDPPVEITESSKIYFLDLLFYLHSCFLSSSLRGMERVLYVSERNNLSSCVGTTYRFRHYVNLWFSLTLCLNLLAE